MSTGPGAVGLLWLWAAVADLGPGRGPEHPAQAPAAMIMEIRAPRA